MCTGMLCIEHGACSYSDEYESHMSHAREKFVLSNTGHRNRLLFMPKPKCSRTH